MALEQWTGFLAVAFFLAIVPGPTVTVIIANSLRYGTKAGLQNVLGTQAGLFLWLTVAVVGLDAAIRLMGVWFDVLRYLGAAYLIWLGAKLLLYRGKLNFNGPAVPPGSGFFLQGFAIILSNPKMLVLFSAIIPPFITQGGNSTAQIFLLGLSFAIIASLTDAFYAVMAGQAKDWLSQKHTRTIEIVSGLFLAAGGVWLALKGR